ncbi:MAG: FadR family transcriptional regulator [Deltaproteobacteria bacterium]|nr:FadR family transcriptional regulator [Deltaproteobacteria bacterium]
MDQIEESIVEGEFKPGDKLPSSAELQKIMGASLGTLREAFRILEQKGLIEVRKGVKGGVFAREATTVPVSEGLGLLIRQRQISLEDLAEFRKVIEAGLIRRVAEKATKRDVDELKQFLVELKPQVERGDAGWKSFLEIEVRLRKTLIRIAGSRMYEVVLVPIHENIFAYAYKYLSGFKDKIEAAYQDWLQIVDALERRDGATAAAVTQDHISRFAKCMKLGRAQSAQQEKGQ